MPIDPARVQALFLAAADLADPTERAAYLDRECAGDAGLRARVDALLRAIDQPDSLLDAPIAPAAGGETQTGPAAAADDTADALAFLSPPGRPDSLGRLGHYEVLEVLGRGGFGIVYRAFDDTLQRVVAVKVLAPSLAVTSPARKRFVREAQSAARIQHENVVRIIEIGEQPLPFLVMEFIAGETLQQRLDRTGPLEVREVLRIGRQIAAGLAAAHETGLIHRDIKPSNILIGKGPDEPVKITDFGLARAADDASLTRSGTVAGTPLYMAPEQARGETLDHRADLFSLGTVLYTMLTGHPPFRAGSTLAVLKRVAEDDPRPMREVIPEVPDWLCLIVEKLHTKEPAARYQSAREVANVLADCEQQLKSHGALRDRSRIPEARSPRRRFGRRLAWAAGLAVMALLFFGVWFGRPAWLYATDRGELELVPQDGLGSVIVLQNDEGVFDDNKLHPSMTDWLDMRQTHTLKLPPGRYQVNAGAYPAGTRIIQWEVTTGGASGNTKRLLPGQGLMGWSTIVTVRRGERVSVRAVVAKPASAPSAQPTEVRQELSGWGTAIDPRGDCRFEPNGDGLVVTVPGGTHNLNPTRDFRDVTAPRILRAAPGDFNLDVKVDSFPVPAAGTSSTGVRSYAGAGLVVWKDAGTFVRFFRAANGEAGRVFASVESYRDGQLQGNQDVDIDDAAAWLRIGRTGSNLRFWSSTDGDQWAEVSVGAPVRLEGPVEAGVAAVNSTTKTFAPRFSRLQWHQGTGDAARPPDSRSDHEKLQGTWVAMNGENHGEALKPDELKRLRLVFTGNRVHVTMVNGLEEEGTFTVDPSRDPRAIDMNFDGRTRRALFGIYRLDGNRLTLCLEDFDRPRPDRFESGPEPKQNRLVVVFRRVDPKDEGWVQLFNGKDLTGWKTHPDQPGDWTVIHGEGGGLLRARGPASYLISERGDYENFILRVEAKVSEPGGFGMYYRSGFGFAGKDGEPRRPSGDVAGYVGDDPLLSQVFQKLFKPNEWFTLEVVADGNHRIDKFNGRVITDVVDKEPTRRKGRLVLRQPGNDFSTVFRKIEIKELPAK